MAFRVNYEKQPHNNVTLQIDRRKSYSPGAKYCFEDMLHPFVRKLFLHLKEAILYLR